MSAERSPWKTRSCRRWSKRQRSRRFCDLPNSSLCISAALPQCRQAYARALQSFRGWPRMTGRMTGKDRFWRSGGAPPKTGLWQNQLCVGLSGLDEELYHPASDTQRLALSPPATPPLDPVARRGARVTGELRPCSLKLFGIFCFDLAGAVATIVSRTQLPGTPSAGVRLSLRPLPR